MHTCAHYAKMNGYIRVWVVALTRSLKTVEGGKKMSRVPKLLAAIAVMVALFATAAYAANITGTGVSDILYESQRADTIDARGGNDQLLAGKFPFDKDNLQGGTGRDQLYARDGDTEDILNGGRGFDKCKGDPRDTYISCEYRPSG